MVSTVSSNALVAALDDILDIIREIVEWPHGDCSACTDRFTICDTCKFSRLCDKRRHLQALMWQIQREDTEL